MKVEEITSGKTVFEEITKIKSLLDFRGVTLSFGNHGGVILVLADNYDTTSRISNVEECRLKADVNHRDKIVIIQNDHTKPYLNYLHLASFKSNYDLITAFNDFCKITIEFYRKNKKIQSNEIIKIGINYQVVNNYYKEDF